MFLIFQNQNLKSEMQIVYYFKHIHSLCVQKMDPDLIMKGTSCLLDKTHAQKSTPLLCLTWRRGRDNPALLGVTVIASDRRRTGFIASYYEMAIKFLLDLFSFALLLR